MAMIGVDIALQRRALEDGRLEASGPYAQRSKLAAWLNLGMLAKVKSQRADGALAA